MIPGCQLRAKSGKVSLRTAVANLVDILGTLRAEAQKSAFKSPGLQVSLLVDSNRLDKMKLTQPRDTFLHRHRNCRKLENCDELKICGSARNVMEVICEVMIGIASPPGHVRVPQAPASLSTNARLSSQLSSRQMSAPCVPSQQSKRDVVVPPIQAPTSARSSLLATRASPQNPRLVSASSRDSAPSVQASTTARSSLLTTRASAPNPTVFPPIGRLKTQRSHMVPMRGAGTPMRISQMRPPSPQKMRAKATGTSTTSRHAPPPSEMLRRTSISKDAEWCDVTDNLWAPSVQK